MGARQDVLGIQRRCKELAPHCTNGKEIDTMYTTVHVRAPASPADEDGVHPLD